MRLSPMALGSALFVAATAARADLRLTWTAPPECPSAAAVEARVTRGERPAADLEADARVAHDGQWQVVLRTKRGTAVGERTIEASTCEGLADATAVVLAVALVGDAPGEAPAPTKVLVGETPAAKPASPVDRDEPKAPLDVRPNLLREHELAVGAAVATDTGSMPATAVGGALSIAWTPGRFRLEGTAALHAGQTRTTESATTGADLRMLVFGGRACWALLDAPVEIGPCAGGAATILSASGFGAAENFDTSARWATLTAGANVRFPLASWLALRAQADAIVPLTRPRFVVEGESDARSPVHEPSAVGLRASLGAELLFL